MSRHDCTVTIVSDSDAAAAAVAAEEANNSNNNNNNNSNNGNSNNGNNNGTMDFNDDDRSMDRDAPGALGFGVVDRQVSVREGGAAVAELRVRRFNGRKGEVSCCFATKELRGPGAALAGEVRAH